VILHQAREILQGLETEQRKDKFLHSSTGDTVNSSTIPSHPSVPNIPLFEIVSFNKGQLSADMAEIKEKYDKVKSILSQVEVDTMTPLQALQFLAKVKEEL
jgi:DNA mismatch repair ATPase MutS